MEDPSQLQEAWARLPDGGVLVCHVDSEEPAQDALWQMAYAVHAHLYFEDFMKRDPRELGRPSFFWRERTRNKTLNRR